MRRESSPQGGIGVNPARKRRVKCNGDVSPAGAAFRRIPPPSPFPHFARYAQLRGLATRVKLLALRPPSPLGNLATTPPSQATAPEDSPVDDWKLYRTRFLANAKRLDEPCTITDVSGCQQQGKPGDYLVEAADGSRRIAPARIFEDVYVELEPAHSPRKGARRATCRPDPQNKQVYNMLWLPIDKYH